VRDLDQLVDDQVVLQLGVEAVQVVDALALAAGDVVQALVRVAAAVDAELGRSRRNSPRSGP
jgi:hypothetical protein